jgi:cytochrome c-type biogenesis protein CcmH
MAARGLIPQSERRSAHAEAARRLLAAADTPAQSWTSGAGDRRGVLIAAVLAPLAALAVYLVLGSPGLPDQPFASRMKAWMASNPASLDPPELAAVLKRLTAERPNDAEGFKYLALAEGASQDAPEAVRALRHALRLAPERADLWEMLGEALVVEAGGQLTPDARNAFAETVKREPKAIVARFQLARARIEAGDKAGGVAEWRALLADLPPDDPRRQPLAAVIAEQTAPTAGQPAVATGQMAAIRGMVERLAVRLKSQPEDPDGWVRLVRAYAVLGEASRRDAALRTARARFRTRPDILSALDAAAKAEPMR